MPPYCDQCGGPIDQLRPGRIARFCSDRCRVAFHRAVIPELMRKEHRWATYEWPSMQPRRTDGRPASTTDPSTWASYPQVRAWKNKGYMLGGNVGCVDIEHCLIGNQLHPAVAELLAPLSDKTYIERSPSGTGLHVFGILNEDRGWRRVVDDGISIELRSREGFMTVTGQRVSKSSRLHPMRSHFSHLAPVLG
ncbi:DNA primase [Mycolicibacterium novocastrense]|uniref:DNA primase n=1 Tax=Mycolicibacterium novocastrense TaxID=59813 RepID=UPI001056D5B3|nr:DNA primase [Mycolicibacterium novocastrense]